MTIEATPVRAAVSPIELEDLGEKTMRTEGAWVRKQNDWIKDVKVDLTVVVGRATTTVERLFAIKVGEVLELDTAIDGPVELRLDGRLIAKGHLMAVGSRFGIRISEIEEGKASGSFPSSSKP